MEYRQHFKNVFGGAGREVNWHVWLYMWTFSLSISYQMTFLDTQKKRGGGGVMGCTRTQNILSHWRVIHGPSGDTRLILNLSPLPQFANPRGSAIWHVRHVVEIWKVGVHSSLLASVTKVTKYQSLQRHLHVNQQNSNRLDWFNSILISLAVTVFWSAKHWQPLVMSAPVCECY